MTEPTIVEIWPIAWPDLVLRTPDCPVCGTQGQLAIPLEFAVLMQPMLWCPVEECEAWTWDPLTPRHELVEQRIEDAPVTGYVAVRDHDGALVIDAAGVIAAPFGDLRTAETAAALLNARELAAGQLLWDPLDSAPYCVPARDHICPECRDGKHRNCSYAWCDLRDEQVPCECTHDRTHQAAPGIPLGSGPADAPSTVASVGDERAAPPKTRPAAAARSSQPRVLAGLTKPCADGMHWLCWSPDGPWSTCACDCHAEAD